MISSLNTSGVPRSFAMRPPPARPRRWLLRNTSLIPWLPLTTCPAPTKELSPLELLLIGHEPGFWLNFEGLLRRKHWLILAIEVLPRHVHVFREVLFQYPPCVGFLFRSAVSVRV